MPKWLIVLLVVLIVVVLGCCGGFAACRWACKAAGTAAQSAIQTATQRAREEIMAATQRAAEETRRQAEQAVAGRGTTATPEEDEDTTTPTPDTTPPSDHAKTNGGTTTPPSGNVTIGSAGQPTVTVGGKSLPTNFPKDVPVMAGLTPGGMSVSDTAKGSGTTMLSGKVSRQDVAAYYQKQMKDQGWTQAQNIDINGLTMLSFEKDQRQVMVQVSDDNGTTLVVVNYESKP
jgi:hypothetical protein